MPSVRHAPLTERDLLALRRPLRTYLQTRVSPEDVEELTQEVLVRVWEARHRTTRKGAERYAVTVASNLLVSRQRRRALDERHAPRLYDPASPDDPAHTVIINEERGSVGAALGALSAEDQQLLLDTYLADRAGGPPRSHSTSAQLASARARARVAYLLTLRRTELPTARCRPVLVALSSGDRRQQARVGAAEHLETCPVCAECAPALQSRHRALFGVLPIPLLLSQVWSRVRQAPRSAQVAGATAAVAAVAAGTVFAVAAAQPGSTQAAAPPASAPPSPAPAAGLILTPAGALLASSQQVQGALHLGETVRAERVPVLAVPADEGFWVGSPAQREWVLITTQDESAVHVRPGDLVSFVGTLQSLPQNPAAAAGLEPAEGLADLQSAGNYVATPAVTVSR